MFRFEAQTAAVAVDSDAENTVAEEGGPRRQADVQPEAQREAPERQPRYDPAAMTCRFFDAGCYHFRERSDQTEVGRLHWMRDTVIKATCKRHKDCACMIEIPPERSARIQVVTAGLGRRPVLQDIEDDLVAWLTLASAVTREQHQTAGRSLKVQRWNVKVRQQRQRAGSR